LLARLLARGRDDPVLGDLRHVFFSPVTYEKLTRNVHKQITWHFRKLAVSLPGGPWKRKKNGR
jgi:hypothetical protein